jgi:NAD(P)H-dependent FMN reductase
MMTGVMDYLISDKEMHGKISATEMTGGVVAGGVAFEDQLSEKALSKKQQRFMGMVHAAQKGEKPASKEVGKVAKTMTKKAAKDFAQTKHKGLPEKVKKV